MREIAVYAWKQRQGTLAFLKVAKVDDPMRLSVIAVALCAVLT
jgi:hypothetical protein